MSFLRLAESFVLLLENISVIRNRILCQLGLTFTTLVGNNELSSTCVTPEMSALIGEGHLVWRSPRPGCHNQAPSARCFARQFSPL